MTSKWELTICLSVRLQAASARHLSSMALSSAAEDGYEDSCALSWLATSTTQSSLSAAWSDVETNSSSNASHSESDHSETDREVIEGETTLNGGVIFRQIFKSKILGRNFSSRGIFLYLPWPRFNVFGETLWRYNFGMPKALNTTY